MVFEMGFVEGKISWECAHMHTQERPIKKARCTLDRLLKGPVSSLMAAEFPLTTRRCSASHRVILPTQETDGLPRPMSRGCSSGRV